MSTYIVIATTCNWCSRQLPPHRVHPLRSNQIICDDCLNWHFHALDFLGGAIPSGCQICGRAWLEIRNSTPTVEVRMYVAPKDGIYQVLCEACVKPYTAKRKDLYRGTRYGESLGHG